MSKLVITRLNSVDEDFNSALDKLLQQSLLVDEGLNTLVDSILKDVRSRGDEAVLEYTRRFDKFSISTMAALVVEKKQMRDCLESLTVEQRDALEFAADRIRRYHQKQKQSSWQYQESDGSVFGQKISPLDKVGIYVPGGKANYPSSMLMNAVPAQVAGVKEIVATVPTQVGKEGNMVFAAAALAGVSRVFTIGGAQAIAALAYGTETVPRVDKITGPGNIYVTIAKKKVFGEVGIDMIAGPSELTIICDGKTNPDWIAMDLFAQAEHDEQAQSILISPEAGFLQAVEASINKLIAGMERKAIICSSLENRGVFIHCENLQDAVSISNRIAPEHLELSVEYPDALLENVVHAGAVFMGRYSAEALGDYCAGPSHVLPTSGTARFFSALGVYDFQKRTSLINCSAEGASSLSVPTAEIARNERLQCHALSAEYRLQKK